MAIEGIKDILAARAEDYRIYYTDREHPNVACRRIVLDCFVASNLYGMYAYETDVLRLYRDVRLSRTAPGRLFIKIYYRFIGRGISFLLRRFPQLRRPTRFVMDAIVARVARTI